jgi:hypothetical protein
VSPITKTNHKRQLKETPPSQELHRATHERDDANRDRAALYQRFADPGYAPLYAPKPRANIGIVH